MTTNQLTYFRDLETQRHNMAMERENLRHNVESERIGAIQAAAAERQSYAAQTSAYASYLQAENAQRRYELEKQLAAYDIQLKQAEYGRTIADTRYTTAQTGYVDARTRGQEVENSRNAYAYSLDILYSAEERKSNINYNTMRTVMGYITGGVQSATEIADTVARFMLPYYKKGK